MEQTVGIQPENGPAARLRPLAQNERIQSLDMLRGLALCGILIMNIQFFGRSFWSMDPRVMNELVQPANRYAWMIMQYLLEGSMRGLFSVLFGAGTLLLIGRLEQRNPSLTTADIYTRRLIWLLIFGLINGYVLNWPGDILYHYAIAGLMLFPFRKASNKWLLFFIATFIMITMLQSWLKKRDMYEIRAKGETAMHMENAGKTLDEDQKGHLKAWQGFQKNTDPQTAREKADKDNKEISTGSYATVHKNMSKWTTKLETVKFHGGMFFDIFIFFLLGLFLFRTGVLSGKKSVAFYAVLAVAGYGFGFGEGYLRYRQIMAANFDMFTYFRNSWLPVDLYQLHRVGTTLGHIGLVLLLLKTGIFRKLLWPFGKVGQMAFTNYLGQSIICSLIFYGYGLGLFGQYQRYELYYFWGGVVLFQILFSVAWLHFFRFGPLEWLWRSLTYWKRQPMLRSNKEVVDMI